MLKLIRDVVVFDKTKIRSYKCIICQSKRTPCWSTTRSNMWKL